MVVREGGREFAGGLIDDGDAPGLHVDVPDASTVEDPDALDPYGDLEALIDGFVECFNARDLDGAVQVLSEDVELPGLGDDDAAGALVRCWEARPNAVLTRGVLEDEPDTDGWWTQPVAVQWDLDGDGAWVRAGLFTFDRDDGADGGTIGLVEYVGDVAVLDDARAEPPDGELVAGGVWAQWEEGSD